MSKRVRIPLAILFSLLFGAIIYEALIPHEPTYQGKTLRFWLEEGIAGGPMATADTNDVIAVRQFGSAAVPVLLKMAQAKDSPLKREWIKLVQTQSLIHIHVNTDEDYHAMACMGFYALGPMGKDAVPSLIKLLKSNRPYIQNPAGDCLGNIGPAAKAAVPVILPFINETNRIVRWDATIILGRIHSEPALVVPVLMRNLNPTNVILSTTIFALGQFGKDAEPAVPALLQCLSNNNEFVRINTTNALKQIDPEAAARAGIKISR